MKATANEIREGEKKRGVCEEKKNLKIRNTVSCLVFFTVSSVTEGIFCTMQRDDFYTSSAFRPLWRHIPVAEAADSGPALV